MSGSRRADSELGYGFTPNPKRLLPAVKAGELAPVDYVIVAFLYDRANLVKLARRHATPVLTLAQIAEGVCWPHTLDALRKRLWRLRAKPEQWFDYAATSGAHSAKYEFTLHPDPPSSRAPLSEEERTGNNDHKPPRATPADQRVRGDRPVRAVSEDGRPAIDRHEPTPSHAHDGADDDLSEEARQVSEETVTQIAPPKRASSARAAAAVRPPQTSQSEPNPSLKEGTTFDSELASSVRREPTLDEALHDEAMFAIHVAPYASLVDPTDKDPCMRPAGLVPASAFVGGSAAHEEGSS